jgi:DNA-directed RNA polymerase I subunit RPA1
MKQIDANTLSCNDINAINNSYGIEAARAGLVSEVSKVFSHYGIEVDHRHLFLLADAISLHGVLNPLSRAGLQHNTSPALKMSFETTMKFLTDACLNNAFDNLSTPSAKLVCGRVSLFIT